MNTAEGGHKKKSGGKSGTKKAPKKDQSGATKDAGMQLPAAGKTATTTIMHPPEHHAPAGKMKQAKSLGEAVAPKKSGKKNKLKKSSA